MKSLAQLFGQNKGDKMTWYEMGAADASDGVLCIPEMYTQNPANMMQYCLGYESVNPGTLTVAYFIGQQPIAIEMPVAVPA